MSEAEIINHLKSVAGFFEIYHKTSFECYRKAKDGSEQEVLVEILDGGTDVDPQRRYHCSATTKDGGKMATGNPAASIEVVLSLVHWDDLDN
jgi:hypothetical protein